jgi:hypothetical protein
VLLPPYLAYLKILHLLDQTIVLVFQHSLLVVLFTMSTSLSEDCAVYGKSFKRLGAHLVRSLACGSYYMPRRADTDEFRGNARSNVSEGADHGTRPNLRSSSYSTLFWWSTCNCKRRGFGRSSHHQCEWC